MSIESNDPCEATEAAFLASWTGTLKDYADKRINSEKCLQASIYGGLRKMLSEDFRVFVEATIWLPDGSRQAIDLLICHEQRVVAAIELKYKPKVKIARIGMYDDIRKLLNLRNYRSKDARIKVEIYRYLGSGKSDKEIFSFAPNRRIIFAGYCRADIPPSNKQSFWNVHKEYLDLPASKRKDLPPKLLICLNRTESGLLVLPEFYGGKSTSITLNRVAVDA